MKAVKGVKCGFDKKTSRITTVLSQPNRVVEQYGALREIIKQYAAPYVEEDKCPYCGQGECDIDVYKRQGPRNAKNAFPLLIWYPEAGYP